MSTPTSLSAWPAGNPDSSITADGLEPSGLAIASDGRNNRLYVASDNGKIAEYVGGSKIWQSESFGDDDDHDFEAVTVAAGELMVGIEGGAGSSSPYTNPVVKRFDPTSTSSKHPIGSFTNSSWELQGMAIVKGGGMEAFAFISREASRRRGEPRAITAASSSPPRREPPATSTSTICHREEGRAISSAPRSPPSPTI